MEKYVDAIYGVPTRQNVNKRRPLIAIICGPSGNKLRVAKVELIKYCCRNEIGVFVLLGTENELSSRNLSSLLMRFNHQPIAAILKL